MTIIRRTNPLGELISVREVMDRPFVTDDEHQRALDIARQVRITPDARVGSDGGTGTGSQSAVESQTVEHPATVDQGT